MVKKIIMILNLQKMELLDDVQICSSYIIATLQEI